MVDAAAKPPTDPPPATPGLAARALPWVVLALAIYLLWHSIGDHPLYSPDEGRYGTASMHMAEGGSWVIPRLKGEAHLTKPPLTYWVQALALRILGHHELGLRAPSVLAGSLTVLVLFLATRRLADSRTAALAVGTVVMMPLFVLVNRLATTDALLTFFWFSALVCGYFAATGKGGWWAALMWAAVACGWLTKGPLALVPIALLLIWLLLAENVAGISRLRLLVGLTLSVLPIGIWVTLVLHEDSSALETWRHEMLDRVTGDGGDHPEPLWYYLPFFLGGLFPATGMLTVPGWNLTWRAAWLKLRSSEPVALLAVAVIAPLIMFSLFSGKLATYLLPLAAPLAFLNAMMLRRWLTGEADRAAPKTRPPEVVATLSICSVLGIAAMITAAAIFKPELLVFAPPLLLVPVACLWLWSFWKRRPRRRGVGLLVVFAAWVLGWAVTFVMENAAHRPHDASVFVDRLGPITGVEHPDIYLFGFSDPTLNFYNHRETERIYRIAQVEVIAGRPDPDGLVVLIDDDAEAEFQERFGEAVALTCVGRWRRSITHDALICIPAARAARLEAESAGARFQPGGN